VTNAATDDCACVPWADAYDMGVNGTNGAFNCSEVGLGFRGDMHNIMGVGVGWTGDEFCEYMHNMKSNVCFHSQIASMNKDVDQVCSVSSACKENIAMKRGKYPKYRMKKCSKTDKLITDLSYSELKEQVIDANQVDAGLTVLLATMTVEQLAENVTTEQKERIKASGIPTTIWTNADNKTDRMVIMKNQVWIQHFHGDAGGAGLKLKINERWTSTCVEGCNMALLQKDEKVKDDDKLFPLMSPGEMAAITGLAASGAALGSTATAAFNAAAANPTAAALNGLGGKLYR